MSGGVLGLDWSAASHIAQMHGAEPDGALADALASIEQGRLEGQKERAG